MSKDDRSVLSWLAFVAALAALVVAIFGLSNSGSSGGDAAGGGGGAKPTINVTMSDFAFEPATITIPTGGAVLHLMNGGAVTHNLKVAELGITSIDIAAGASYDLTVPATPAGTYRVICPQAGHEGAGMVGSLVVSDSGSGGSSAGGSTGSTTPTETGHDAASNSAMDAKMLAAAMLYPAKTEAHGGRPAEYTVSDDGYKVFNVDVKVVDWEVEPGKFVKAWTYNGTVPAPTIQVFTGDKVRIVFKNDTPQTTSLHFHGIQVPNLMDGVDPYTEDPTRPGETHTYEWVAKGPSVGIYHSHHNAQEQIPNGMFGTFLVDDIPTPQVLIDKGYQEKPVKTINMVLNDAGTIGLSLNGKSFPATEPYTMRLGETIKVNYQNEGLLVHPMHLHQPMGWIIAKDGVPLITPEPTDTLLIAPGERYTVLYKAVEPGVWAWHCHILTHAETADGMRYMVTAIIVER
ncbi:MAG: multicopper oxidase domain-containing protein, partial [Ilumatobacteraceae bacterium]